MPIRHLRVGSVQMIRRSETSSVVVDVVVVIIVVDLFFLFFELVDRKLDLFLAERFLLRTRVIGNRRRRRPLRSRFWSRGLLASGSVRVWSDCVGFGIRADGRNGQTILWDFESVADVFVVFVMFWEWQNIYLIVSKKSNQLSSQERGNVLLYFFNDFLCIKKN